MEYHLALELKMPVAEMRRRVSSHEFAEWCAFFTWREQVRAAEAAKSSSAGSPRRGGMGRG